MKHKLQLFIRFQIPDVRGLRIREDMVTVWAPSVDAAVEALQPGYSNPIQVIDTNVVENARMFRQDPYPQKWVAREWFNDKLVVSAAE